MKIFSVVLLLLFVYSHNILAEQRKSEDEYKKVVIEQHKDLLYKFSHSPSVISALITANKANTDIIKIMHLDASWQLNRELQISIMMNPIASQINKYV